jgi:hypothetical protein
MTMHTKNEYRPYDTTKPFDCPMCGSPAEDTGRGTFTCSDRESPRGSCCQFSGYISDQSIEFSLHEWNKFVTTVRIGRLSMIRDNFFIGRDRGQSNRWVCNIGDVFAGRPCDTKTEAVHDAWENMQERLEQWYR